MFTKRILMSVCLLLFITSINSPTIVQASNQPASPVSPPALSQNGLATGIIAHWGDGPRVLLIDGTTAYMGENRDLVIMDVTDPAHAKAINRVHLGMPIGSLAISGSYLYLVGGSTADIYTFDPVDIYIFDVSIPDHPQRVGVFTAPDHARKIAISGQYLYLADVNDLRIFSIANPISPIEVGSFPAQVADFVIRGSLAYLGCPDVGLKIVNISNPAAPTLVGSLPMDQVNTLGLVVQGNYVYFAHVSHMPIIDISNPATPVQLGDYALPNSMGNWKDVAVSGTVAYIDDGYGFEAIDVSLPSQPKLIGVYPAGFIQSLLISGNYLYTADNSFGLRIFDVSDTQGPVQVGSVDTPGELTGISIKGSYAYASALYDGLLVFDLSNPASPLEVTQLKTPNIPNYAKDIVISGNYAYMVDKGIFVIDIHDPGNPQIVNSINVDEYNRLKLIGCYLYAVGNGVHIFSLTDPANPVEVSQYKGDGFGVSDFDVSGHYVFANTIMNSMKVIDFTDFAHPKVVSNTPEAYYDLAVNGNIAYASGMYKTFILDITDPANLVVKDELPQVRGNLKIVNGILLSYQQNASYESATLYSLVDPYHPKEISQFQAVKDIRWNDCLTYQNYLIVAAFSGLRLINISDVNAIHVEASYDIPMHTGKVAVSQNYLFTFDTIYWGYYAQPGMHVMDMSQPTDPELKAIAWLPLPGGIPWDVDMDGHLIALAMGNGGLQILDVSDPVQPFIVSKTLTSGYAWQIAIRNSKVYVLNNGGYGDGANKLDIFDISDSTDPILLGSIDTNGAGGGLALDGDFAYVSKNRGVDRDNYAGFERINVSDPQNPYIDIQYEEFWGTSQDIAVKGNTMYWSTNGGLRIYNLDFPSDPFRVANLYDLPLQQIHQKDGWLYSSNKNGGFSIYNIRASETPVAINTIPTIGEVGGFATNQNRLYLADGTVFVVQMNLINLVSVYLPLTQNQYKEIPGIYGQVKAEGMPITGVDLELRFYDGQNWSTAATATTNDQGRYQFLNAPSLSPGQYYYIRYLNTNPDNFSHLSLWQTKELSSYSNGSSVNIGNFDIENVYLGQPYDQTTTNLPATFSWIIRNSGRNDSYEFNLQSTSASGLPYYYSEPLGRISTYSLTALPTGFDNAIEYYWYIGIFGSDGGYGLTKLANRITFSTAANVGKISAIHGPEIVQSQIPLSSQLYEAP